MYSCTLPSPSALDGGGWSTPRPGRLTPGKNRYPLYRRLGGPQGRSVRVRKISPPTGIRSSDLPARSESLYRLSYPGPFLKIIPKTLVSPSQNADLLSTLHASLLMVFTEPVLVYCDNRAVTNKRVWTKQRILEC